MKNGMQSNPEFYEFAGLEIARRGDRALAFAREQRDMRYKGQSSEDRLRQRAFWGSVAAAIEQLERIKPSSPVPACLICGGLAITTRLLDGGVEQQCVDCGLFQVAAPLAANWELEPTVSRLTPEVDAYIDACIEQGEIPVFSEGTLARIGKTTCHG